MTADTLTCYCGAPMERKSLRFGPFMGCTRWPACDGTAALRADGTLASTPCDAETKRARQEAHEVFDALWQSYPNKGSKGARRRCYKLLQYLMGLPEEDAHIGFFSAEQCRELVEKLAVVEGVR